MSPLPAVTDAQSEAALQWLVRINEQPEQARCAAFKRWLLADPRHPVAYDHARALWNTSAQAAAALADEERLALQHYLGRMTPPAARRPWRRRAGALAMAACLIMAIGVLGGWQPGHWLQDVRADFSTSVDRREVTLADHSTVTLDAHSAIAVQFDKGERRVRLLHGAAFFKVTHTGEPFVVQAADGQVRVLGTEFEVREQGSATQVTVRAGRVAVSPIKGAVARELVANQQVTYSAGQVSHTLSVDSEQRLTWRDGWLTYSQAPLAQVVSDLGRYYPGHILLLDEALGRREVSGSFPIAEPLQALDSLGKVLGFSRQTVLGRLTVLR
nr:FecR domain-containing protein [uncultured Pseudomonas sp.]